MISWPESLPQRVLADFEIVPRTGLADEKEIRNPQRTRTYPERDATFKVFMDSAQLSVFRTFWNTDLNQQAPFTAPWLKDLGYTFHFLRFRTIPVWEKSGGGYYYTVTLPLEIIAGVETDKNGDIQIWGALPSEPEEAPVAKTMNDTRTDNNSNCSQSKKSPFSILCASLLTNDSNENGRHEDLSITRVFNPSGCRVLLNGDFIEVTYPDTDGGCNASFEYNISNLNGSTATGTVTIDACSTCSNCSCGCGCDV